MNNFSIIDLKELIDEFIGKPFSWMDLPRVLHEKLESRLIKKYGNTNNLVHDSAEIDNSIRVHFYDEENLVEYYSVPVYFIISELEGGKEIEQKITKVDFLFREKSISPEPLRLIATNNLYDQDTKEDVNYTKSFIKNMKDAPLKELEEAMKALQRAYEYRLNINKLEYKIDDYKHKLIKISKNLP